MALRLPCARVRLALSTAALRAVCEQVLSWLQRNVETLVKALDAGTLITAPFALFRAQHFNAQPIPNKIKMLQKSDYSDYVSQLPAEFLRPVRTSVFFCCA